MRLDDAVQHFDVSPALYGTTLYVKLLSFNTVGGGLQSLADVSPTTFTLAAQVQTGSGFSFIADKSSTTVGDPGPGKLRWNNASQAAANQIVFDAQTADGANMVAYFANVGSAGYLDLRDVADPAKWATYTLTSSNAPAGYQVFGVQYQAGGAAVPNGDTLLATFSPTPPTGVTQVGLVLPASTFNVTTASVTTTGNLTASLVAQNSAVFFAGPLTGNAATPTWRAIAATDFNAGTNASNITVLRGDMTWGAPTSSGASVDASWTFDTATTAADPGNKKFRLDSATLGSVTAIYLNDTTNNGFDIGTIVGFLAAGYRIYIQQKNDAARAVLLQVSGTATDNTGWWTVPVTVVSSGTLYQNNADCGFIFVLSAGAATAGAQNASLVYAGPASGNAATPTFRSLAGGDMPRLTINTQTANYTLALADGNVAWVDMNSANATVVTVPSQANVTFANGTSILINRRGAGNVTISAQANVTVANASSSTIRAQNGTVGLTMRAPDAWVLFGDTT